MSQHVSLTLTYYPPPPFFFHSTCRIYRYVGGFSLVAMESPPHLKEFNLGAASVGDSLGISIADSVAIILQKAIYRNYGISDE